MTAPRCCAGRILALGALLLASGALPAAPEPWLWQTNSQGDDIHVFDLASGRLLRRLVVGPEPHGIAAPADGQVVFVTLEANRWARGQLLWIDPQTFGIRQRMEICPEPHALAATPDGRWLYIPCRDEHYWVVDAQKHEVVARIRTGGRPHNVRISSDGRLALLSPMGPRGRVTVVDVEARHAVAGEIRFAGSVRPSALSSDGRLFQQVDGLNGFQVADVARREVIATVEHAMPLGWLLVHPRLGWLGPAGLQRCHGLAIRPGEREIWSSCGASVAVHDAMDYRELARIALPGKAYWVTFAPDGSRALLALAEANQTAIVDAATRRVIALLPVGEAPKRNLVIDVDASRHAPPRAAILPQ